MKLFILFTLLAVISFGIGRYSKRRPVYHADQRKLNMKLYINGIKDDGPFWEQIEVDSYSTYTFKQLSDIRLDFFGITETTDGNRPI